MTTVTVEVDCPQDKVVRVTILDDGVVVANDTLDSGEVMTYSLQDMQEIFIKEPTKE